MFLNIAKAFDAVDHKILIDKIIYYGVKGAAIEILKSYLTNRKQYASIISNGSKKIFIATLLPQGSVLGPLVFLIYVNELAICCKFDTLMYADDTILTMFIKIISNLTEIAEFD